jgi:hypothetical protein
MTWLGKIFTFLVLLGAVVWAYFTVTTYAARTNWKARSDMYKKAYEESEAARVKEAADFQKERSALVAINAAEKWRADDYAVNVEILTAASKSADKQYAKLEKDYREADVQANILRANKEAAEEEARTARTRNTELEDLRVALVLQKAAADFRRLQAENEKKLAQALVEDYLKKVETLTTLVTELRQSGSSGQAAVTRSVNKIPAPLPDGIRGTVTRDIAGDFVQINLGIDHGLDTGSVLDVYREEGDGKYLGTIVITKSLRPKEAVGEFRPARNVPVAALRPDELPRKGDTVGVVNTGGIRPNR